MTEEKPLKLKKVLKTITKELAAAEDEGAQFNNGKDVAGTRCRAHLMNIQKLCKPGRYAITTLRNKRKEDKTTETKDSKEKEKKKKGKKKK